MSKDSTESDLDPKNLNCLLKCDQDVDNLINILKKQVEYYKTKNAQHQQILSKLKVTPDSLNITSRETLTNLAKLQEASGVDKLEIVDVELSYLDQATNRLKYQSEIGRLKNHCEILSELTENVQSNTKNVEREIDEAKDKINNILTLPESDLQKLQHQIKSYEESFQKYIDKYPWINDPEYNLLSIQKEIQKVYELQEKADKLKVETEDYCGLSPDLFSAKMQLMKLKTEYENICKLITENKSKQ